MRRRRSEEAMTRQLFEMAAQQIPGDTYRNLVIQPVVLGPDLQAHARAGVAA